MPWWGFSLIIAGVTALLAVGYKLVNGADEKKTEKEDRGKEDPAKEKERNASEQNQEEGKDNPPKEKEDLDQQRNLPEQTKKPPAKNPIKKTNPYSPEYKKAQEQEINSNPPNKTLETLKKNNKFRSI